MPVILAGLAKANLIRSLCSRLHKGLSNGGVLSGAYRCRGTQPQDEPEGS